MSGSHDPPPSSTLSVPSTSLTNDLTRIGWAPNPSQRGTYQILLTSFATILLCTYTALHHDIPRRRLPSPTTTTTTHSTSSAHSRSSPLSAFLHKTLLFTGACLAPEFVTSYAFFDFLEARKLTAWFHRQGVHNWSQVQSFYFLMGGLVYAFGSGGGGGIRGGAWGKETGGGAAGDEKSSRRSRAWQQQQHIEVLDLDNVGVVMADGANFSAVTEHDVWSLGRNEVLGKLLTVSSAVYMLVQIAGRLGLGLEVACLEVVCVAYVPLALLCCLFWWNKPFGAKSHLTVPSRTRRTSKSDLLWRISSMPVVFDDTPHSRLTNSCAFALIALIFASPQIALWNSTVFAHNTERLVWRTGTAAMMVVAVLQIPLLFMFHVRGKGRADGGKRRDQIVSAVVYFLAALYCVARVCVIVETFYSLHSSPASVYQAVRWTEYIPHLA